jgi:PAS domain S-box-containing protein
MPMADAKIIQDVARLDAVRATGLLDAPPSPTLERLTRLVAKLLHAPSAVVTLIDRDRQFFAASNTERDNRSGPLSHSFCQHVVATAAPLIVSDAATHPLLHDNRAVTEEGVLAYAGMPLVSSDGLPLGSVCAFDTKTRVWSSEEVEILQDLARAAMTEIELRVVGRLLEEQEEQLRELLDHTDEIVMRLDVDGTIRYTNRAWQQLMGADSETSVSGWAYARVVEEDRAVLWQAWTDALAGEPSSDFVVSFFAGDGRKLVAEMRMVPRVSDGGVRGVRIFGHDVTEIRQAIELKDQMIGLVSHELRTPIGAVQGALTLLGRLLPADLGPREKEMLAMARRNADRLLALVNDLLDLERLEAGHAMPQLGNVALGDVFGPVRDATQPLAERAGVRLEFADGQARLRAEGARIAQVLINLIGNAIKFTPTGGAVTVEAVDQGEQWCIQVRDTGRGIPSDQVDKVFERFAQVKRTDATEKGGTGLGLAIARAIVLQHGGRIWVESEVGKGSVFQFTIPRAVN